MTGRLAARRSPISAFVAWGQIAHWHPSQMVRPRRKRFVPMITDDLASLPDVGRVSIGWLRAVGIETTTQLRHVGPAEAYGRVAYRFGSAVNRNLLYALAMGLEGRQYNDATDDEKRRLCEEAGIPFKRKRVPNRKPNR
jgi:TfoX-like protein